MTQRRSILARAVAQILIVSSLWACENVQEPVPIAKQGNGLVGADAGQTKPEIIRDSDGQIVAIVVSNRPPVTNQELNSSQMRLNGFSLGLADSFSSQFPLVSFFMPALADYAQLIRCPDDIRLEGLEDVDIGNPSSDAAQRIFEMTDFWGKAVNNPLCVAVSEGLSDRTFIDFFSPKNGHVYLGRACVIDRRKPVDTMDAVGNCSRQVMISGNQGQLTGYVNQVYERIKDKEAQYRQIRDEADTLGRVIYEKTVEMNAAMKACVDANAKQAANLQVKENVLKIVNAGIGIGAKMFAPTQTAAAGLLGSAIRDLFVSPDDFPKSCTAAEKIRLEGEITAKRLADLQMIYKDILPSITSAGQEAAQNAPGGNP